MTQLHGTLPNVVPVYRDGQNRRVTRVSQESGGPTPAPPLFQPTLLKVPGVSTEVHLLC